MILKDLIGEPSLNLSDKFLMSIGKRYLLPVLGVRPSIGNGEYVRVLTWVRDYDDWNNPKEAYTDEIERDWDEEVYIETKP